MLSAPKIINTVQFNRFKSKICKPKECRGMSKITQLKEKIEEMRSVKIKEQEAETIKRETVAEAKA